MNPTAQQIQLNLSLQPKQWALYDAIEDARPDSPTVLGYGGSRGAAKSGAVRRCALRLATTRSCIIWIVRRVWDDLNKDHVLPLFEEHPFLRSFWHAGEKKLNIRTDTVNSTIFFIHAGDSGRAKRKARGPQAHYIFLEQAEEFTQEEMEQLAGSNRAPGVPPGYCKRIFTFNPGGVGTTYLRRIFHKKEYRDNENPNDYLFIQGFGWDNYEWFRGLGIVSERRFYESPEWDEKRRFEVFINETDFGRKLNALPPSQRIGELMGSFDSFSGQYFADVWEQSTSVLPQEICGQIIQPWWRRWLATDWGFSHYAATGWFASGLLPIEQCRALLGIESETPVRVIIQYRELVTNDVPEPDLARLIISMTPPAERREIRDHWIGHDAWAKRGSAHTVVEQMDPIFARDGLPRLSRADIDRQGGWRLLYNALGSGRRLRKAIEKFRENPDDVPAFFVSAACPEVIGALPVLKCRDDNPQDVEKMAGQVFDDVADMVRYGLKSYLTAEPKVPPDVMARQTFEAYQDPTARAMAMLRLAAQQDEGRYIRRRRTL